MALTFSIGFEPADMEARFPVKTVSGGGPPTPACEKLIAWCITPLERSIYDSDAEYTERLGWSEPKYAYAKPWAWPPPEATPEPRCAGHLAIACLLEPGGFDEP